MADNLFNCANIMTSFHLSHHNSSEHAYREIMSWLSPLEPKTRHQGVQESRFESIGDWLLETREFREWRGGAGGADKALLFCSGTAGVGKTYLK